MKLIPLNTVDDLSGAICRTILATYHKIGTYNVFQHDFPAVLIVYEEDTDKHRQNWLLQDSVCKNGTVKLGELPRKD